MRTNQRCRMKYLLFIFLYPIFMIHSYELSICAIFKDDAKYLPEWIEFHENQGVEHFYLYDNGSTDNPESFLNPYIQKGLVEIIDWKFEHQDQSKWNGIQTLAYMDCIIRIRENDKWCAFLDTDEFLFSPITKDIRKILQDYEDYSCISVYWRCYGTSDIEKVPDH